MKILNRFGGAALVCAALFISGELVRAQSNIAPSTATSQCAADQVLVTVPDGVHGFNVEVADTEQERARGLMFREEMAADAGMLFVYPDSAPRAFWMRNTLIPLDIIFADARGTVVSIAANAVPGDETPLPSDGAAQFVLEVNGGVAQRLGITAGHSVLRHRAIPSAQSSFPCVALE